MANHSLDMETPQRVTIRERLLTVLSRYHVAIYIAVLLWRKIRNSLPLLVFAVLVAGNAWALEEICGNGLDDASSGYTYGACPAGWMNAVWSKSGCDRECPDLDGGGEDDDDDGYATTANGYYSTGSAIVKKNQTSVTTIAVDRYHTLSPLKRATFYDSVSGSTVTRNILESQACKANDLTGVSSSGTTLSIASGFTYATSIGCAVVSAAGEVRLITNTNSDTTATLNAAFSSNLSNEAVGLYPTITVSGAAVTVADGAAISAAPLLDCDDKNRKVYPGIYRTCGTDGTQLCQTDGTWSACSEGELCEATGSGDCYYIDPVSGSNSNNGLTRATAFADQRMVGYSYGGDTLPAGSVTLKAGDAVYLMGGVHSTPYNSGQGSQWLTVRTVYGDKDNRIRIKNYPGEEPVVRYTDQAYDGCDIYIFQSSHFTIEGIEFDGQGTVEGCGINIGDRHGEVRNVYVHDKVGNGNNNLSGMYLAGSQGLTIHHNWIGDVWSTTGNTDGDNQIIAWRGNPVINHNTLTSNVVQSDNTYGAANCIQAKHADYGSMLEIVGNNGQRCAHASGTAAGGSSPGMYIAFNRFVESAGLRIRNVGGNSYNHHQTITQNTFKNGANEFMVAAFQKEYNQLGSSSGSVCAGDYTITNEVWTRNVIETPTDAIYTINTYTGDPLYYEVLDSLTINDNTIDSTTASNCMFCSNNADETCSGRGILGATHSVATWQALGFDTTSRFGAVTWNEFQQSTNPADCERGWRSNCNSLGAISGSGFRPARFGRIR